jgi:ABC-type transport system substrate-binding protein
VALIDKGVHMQRFGRRDFFRAAGAATATLGIGGLAAACGPGSSTPTAQAKKTTTPGAPKRGGTLRAGISGGSSSDSLDALNIANNADEARVFALYDPLVTIDNNAAPKLALAKEISPNADATLWTIRLRSGVTFHDGKPLTSADIGYTFQRIMNPKSPGAGAGPLAAIDIAGMKQVDDLTLTVPFRSRSPYNETHWDDPHYNSLYAAAISTVDQAKRTQIAQDMQVIDYDSGGLIIPYFCPVIDAHSSKIMGIEKSKVGRPLGNYNWASIWIG